MEDERPRLNFTLNATSVIAFSVTGAFCALVWMEIAKLALWLL